MSAAIAPVTALLLSVGLLLMGNGLQATLLPLRASIEAFSPLEIGVLGSAYFIGFAVGCLYGPKLVRRSGHIRTFLAMVALASAFALAHALVFNPLVWWLLRGASGYCFAVLYIVIESWLNESATNENRGLVFSVYTMVNLSVMTLGQLMLMLAPPSDFSLFALASILVSVAAVPVALTTSSAPAPIQAVKLRFRKLYRRSPVGVAGCLAMGLTGGAFWGLGPVFAQTQLGSTTGVALFMSAAVLAGALGQYPLGLLSDRMDRRWIMIACCAGAGVAGLCMVLANMLWPSGIFYAAFLYGAFAFPLYPVSVAHTNDYVPAEDFVETASGLLMVYALGAALGPMLASVLVQVAGHGGLFTFTAVVHALTLGFIAYRMNVRERAPEEGRVDFADALLAAQTISTVDVIADEAATGPSDPAASDLVAALSAEAAPAGE